MIITQKTLNDLTLATFYVVKFATLQHMPSYIQVTANDGTHATVQFYDPTESTVVSTQVYPSGMSVFLIDITQ